MEFDIAIVGAGPAGLFAALEIAKIAEGKVKTVLIDKGARASKRFCPLLSPKEKCTFCIPCHITYGIGGAGTYSSGIINLRPDIGGDLHELLGSWDEAQKLIDYVDQLFVKFGAPRDRVFSPDAERVREIQRKVAKVGGEFIPIKQRHMGTEENARSN